MSPTPTEECQSAPELLPCPFCGGSNVSRSMGKTGDGKPWPYIECESCAASAEPHVWNRRPDPVRASWQPIETAPKDEIILVGYGPIDDMEGEVVEAYDNGKPDWCWEIPDSNGCCRSRGSFTHWMPLPAPPGSAPLADAGGSIPSNSSSDPVRAELLAALKEIAMGNVSDDVEEDDFGHMCAELQKIARAAIAKGEA